MDTVFGTVAVRSPQLMSCPCDSPFYLETLFSPLAQILLELAAPDLLVLPARLAAKMSDRQVVWVLKEFLQSPEKFNHVAVQNQTLRVSARVDGIDLPAGEALPPHSV